MNINQKLYLTFRALRHKNYMLFFTGQCISLVGTWIQQIAISWLVYRLTHSALLMGVIMFAGSIPALLIPPFAGVFIDRINKHKTLILIQALFMFEALTLAILTLSGIVQVWHIVIITALMGITGAIDMPLRQAFVVKLVDETNMGNAISLNSSMFNLARMIGPAIAGVLIAYVGEGTCFLINALSYIAVIGALFAMTINYKPEFKKKKENVIHELVNGFQYSFRSTTIKTALLYIAVLSFVGMSFQVLMPIFADKILNGNAQTLGLLMSASGIGSLFGALKLASKKNSKGLDKIVSICSLLLGFGLVGLSFTNITVISATLLFIIGYAFVTILAACNTIIQEHVDEDKRGRVMSIYTMAFIGVTPFGTLFEGAVAEKIGVPHTFLLNGIIMLLFIAFYANKLQQPAKEPIKEPAREPQKI